MLTATEDEKSACEQCLETIDDGQETYCSECAADLHSDCEEDHMDSMHPEVEEDEDDPFNDFFGDYPEDKE